MIITSRRAVAVVGVCATVLGATTALGAAAQAATTHGRPAIVLHTSGGHVSAPATTRPGQALLHNTSRHPVMIARSRHGADAAAFAKDLNASSARPMMHDFTVIDMLPPRADTIVALPRGSYYLADAMRARYTAASVRAMSVRGPVANVRAPRSRRAVLGRTSHLRGAATMPRTGYLTIRNRTSHLQGFYLMPVRSSASAEEVARFLAKPSILKMLRLVSLTGRQRLDSWMLSSGLGATSSYHLRAGRYLLIALTYPTHGGKMRLPKGHAALVTIR